MASVLTVVALSDTHMRHGQIDLPPCDLLIHTGDFTRHGTREETLSFLPWMGRQRAEAKVLLGGNHDRWAEEQPDSMHELAEKNGIRYLLDEGATLLGLSIWGSPVTPAFRSMAFNRDRGAPIRRHWDTIPDKLDILLTHGPPRGLGDRVFFGAHVGCADLLAAVRRQAPRVHFFGHIHEAAGEYTRRGLATRFVNAATSRLFGGTRGPVVMRL